MSVSAAALAALVLLPATPASGSAVRHPAADADGYRYWSFWQQKKNGSWSYATEGPATQRPEDGDTLGFRFALSENSQQADKPRGTVTFADACAKTAAKADSKRVAVRIDFGTRTDAPKGEPKSPPAPHTGCARIPENGTAADALAKVATPLRYNSQALLCAIAHYPAKGCGEQAKGDGGSSDNGTAKRDGSAGSEDGKDRQGDGISTGLGLTAGIAAVAILGAAALWQARRRRQ
ncbi:SCO2322 family protein [Streptomyces sp. 3N207]|uniref:SCO2322 family protein n=1 Tax=Streptomyces sp. 3N207 TaxID=3457417 RepID=UPI003FCF5254